MSERGGNGHEQFRNRVVERGRERIGNFLPNRANPKTHPQTQQVRMGSILETWGKVGEVYVYRSERNGGEWTLFDGHMREELDPDEVWDVAYTDLTDEGADVLAAMYDKVGEGAIIDPAVMAVLMVSEPEDQLDATLRDFLSELAQEAGVAPRDVLPPEDFPEYGDDIDVDYRCPKCGYSWSGMPT